MMCHRCRGSRRFGHDERYFATACHDSFRRIVSAPESTDVTVYTISPIGPPNPVLYRHTCAHPFQNEKWRRLRGREEPDALLCEPEFTEANADRHDVPFTLARQLVRS